MPFCSFVAVRASGLEGEKEFRIGKGMGHRSSYPHCPSVFEIGALCPDSYMYCFHTPVSVPSSPLYTLPCFSFSFCRLCVPVCCCFISYVASACLQFISSYLHTSLPPMLCCFNCLLPLRPSHLSLLLLLLSFMLFSFLFPFFVSSLPQYHLPASRSTSINVTQLSPSVLGLFMRS